MAGKEIDLHVQGEALIYRNDKFGYPSYSLKLSNNIQGRWESMYLNVGFPRGVEVPNRTNIIIKDSFLTFFKNKMGASFCKLQIVSFDISNEQLGEIDIPSNDILDENEFDW